MANVTFEKTSPVRGRIHLAFSREELNEKLNEALKKERKRVNLKGFRKGKTPLSAVRKLLGNQVFGPLLDREIQQALFGYIDEHKLRLIFSPIPDESVETPQISAANIQDLDLYYDLGLEPEFELNLPEQTFTRFVLEQDEEKLDERVMQLRRQMADSVDVEEGTPEDSDLLKVKIEEVDGDIENEATFYFDNLSDEGKAVLGGLSVGESTEVSDLATLENDSTSTYVNKYLLDLEDVDTDLSGKTFKITLNKISRRTPAELDEEFFTKYDATGEITTEEQLRTHLAETDAAGFLEQGNAMANVRIQEALVEANDFELPLELMRKLREDDEEMENFERGVRWMIVRGKLIDKYGIQVEYEDIRQEALGNLLRMMGGRRPDFLTDEFLDNYVSNMIKEEGQRDELMNAAIHKKALAAVREDLTVEDKPLTADAFNEQIKQFNEEFATEEE